MDNLLEHLTNVAHNLYPSELARTAAAENGELERLLRSIAEQAEVEYYENEIAAVVDAERLHPAILVVNV